MNRNTPDRDDPGTSAPALASHFSPLTSSPWLASRFLFPCDPRRHADHPHWDRAGRWFVLWGLVIGLVYALVFNVAWRWFGEYQYIRWLPAVAVLTADLAYCGYRLLAGVAHAASRRDDATRDTTGFVSLPGLVAVLLVTIAKYAMLVSLPRGQFEPMSTLVPEPLYATGWLGFLYPPALYRPLIVMPVWGRWAMTLTLSIGRTAPHCPARLQRLAVGTRLRHTLVLWLAVTALTAWYCGRSWADLPQGLAIGLGVTTACYLAAFVLGRRFSGQTEATVSAVGLVGELAFLALYLPIARSIYWY
ncbi:MAG: adenosylcobinamide-GDP ribazoletransferase [Phycisphaerae bacterium]|nr:adenosylcobinamide-GDP ribazoletransferase [Phycisphaerae bacterium]